MEYVYAELVKNGKDIKTVPKSKMVATCTVCIIKHYIVYDQVPAGYKTQVKAELKKQGYGTDGEPLVEE